MRVLFLLILLTGFTRVECREASSQAQSIDAMYVTGDNEACAVLSDGSFWKLFAFEKRSRGPLEWLRGDDLGVPECFVTHVGDWGVGKKVGCCLAPQVDTTNAYNATELLKADHVLIDAETGLAIFAVAISPNQCFEKIRQREWSRGYDCGFSEGRDKGREEERKLAQPRVTASYDQGYRDGYTAGAAAQRSLNPPPPPYPGR